MKTFPRRDVNFQRRSPDRERGGGRADLRPRRGPRGLGPRRGARRRRGGPRPGAARGGRRGPGRGFLK